jgi:flagellar biosynthesis/type III secretory pathway chaperone
MKEILEKLISCMEKEITIYTMIYKLVSEERKMLVKNQELELAGNLDEQNELIFLAYQEENKRMAVMGQIAKILELQKHGSGIITVSNIANAIEGGYRTRLKKLRDSLKSIVNSISDLNQNNIFLIEQGRGNSKNLLDLIINKDGTSVYRKDGRMKSSAMSISNIINKVC